MQHKDNLFPESLFKQKGFNLIAIFNLNEIAQELLLPFNENGVEYQKYRQLILIANAGKGLWNEIKKTELNSADPIDEYTVQSIQKILSRFDPNLEYEISYPRFQNIGLQKLGELAGWHHPSPFRVGIHPHWGTWYAYRAVILSNSRFNTSQREINRSVCHQCTHQLCIAQCPARAFNRKHFDLQKCMDYRLQENSPCAYNCLARYACPEGVEHRYTDEQIAYHYGVSLKMIKQWKESR